MSPVKEAASAKAVRQGQLRGKKRSVWLEEHEQETEVV